MSAPENFVEARASGSFPAVRIEPAEAGAEGPFRHHLLALTEVPTDVTIPPRLVITRESGERVLDGIAEAPRPTKAMRELFAERKGNGTAGAVSGLRW